MTPFDPNEIIARVCEKWGMDPAVMRSPKRNRRVVEVRRHCARELRSRGMSLSTIGEFIGLGHHTSVLHLLKDRA